MAMMNDEPLDYGQDEPKDPVSGKIDLISGAELMNLVKEVQTAMEKDPDDLFRADFKNIAGYQAQKEREQEAAIKPRREVSRPWIAEIRIQATNFADRSALAISHVDRNSILQTPNEEDGVRYSRYAVLVPRTMILGPEVEFWQDLYSGRLVITPSAKLSPNYAHGTIFAGLSDHTSVNIELEFFSLEHLNYPLLFSLELTGAIIHANNHGSLTLEEGHHLVQTLRAHVNRYPSLFMSNGMGARQPFILITESL